MTALKVGSESWWQSKHGPEWQRLNDEMFEVTFWWRDPQGSEEYSTIKRVWVYITGVTDHHQNSQPRSMQRIAGTDVWQWTTQLNANWRGSYCFIPTERDDIFSAPSPDRLELREGWRKLLPQAIADPLNPQSWKGGTLFLHSKCRKRLCNRDGIVRKRQKRLPKKLSGKVNG